MPKILIVDDEAIFRKGLQSMIAAWDKDWDVVGAAKDGIEALERLEELRPDAVLTDIRMPRMDGLQLQKIAKERFPEIASVVISGYEDFAYVQQSMRHGSKDYLLKPVEREELGRVLDQLKAELLQRTPEPVSAEERNEDMLIRQHVTEHVASGLLQGSVHPEDMKLLQRIGIDFDQPYFTCLVIKLDKDSVDRERYSHADPSLFQLYIQQFVQEVLDNRASGLCFVISDTEVVALVNLADERESKIELLEIAASIRRQIRSLSNITVTIGIGTVVEGAQSIPRAYHEAGIALLYRLIVGGDKVLDYEQTAKENQFKSGIKKWSWEALEQAINEGKTDEVKSIVETVIQDLCRIAQTPEAVHQQICKLLIHYYELAEDLGITKQWLRQTDIRTLLFDICSISAIDELVEECRKLLGRLTAGIAARGRNAERDPIEQSVRYLERHYREPVTLKEAADRVFLNQAYFSSLFKQRTGTTFVERLTELRVAEAKRRIAMTDEKIAVIAEGTGFLNLRHFNRVFKNETGFTPKDYRERVKQETGKH
ncbi:hypothetical protein BG53_00245 [Paenibacillus darwinianus]|uniref:AraC family transcriptional regulator n=1 Tax=Paenibacillus darwinianus TaxID=1380763 RepID=A0A9W5S1P5_9BACL|nr:response regulator [Paenibacillus darwinianus]EXX88484.1 hypothetical protein BG52_02130 [Paenibacillus darwinianus]EXX89268.1 hypothetical protein BG53_00245 [Paenibacillus darwinianus]EXX89984.1 hypothetical protein CH50_00330 [Paenibacillus darwinianus]